MRIWISFLLIAIFILGINQSISSSAKQESSQFTDAIDRCQKISARVGMPWQYLLAMHQYEKNIDRSRSKGKRSTHYSSIPVPPHLWAGHSNPVPEDSNPSSIRFFDGIGMDGDDDKQADRTNASDVLHSLAVFLTRHGTDESNVRQQLWNYYQNSMAVDIITHTAQIYKRYPTTDLQKSTFPIPVRSNYSYKNSWGDARGWGGSRIHEGTDIFADYGTPISSTCYGYIELIGWNKYGGWRIGIRDIHNRYHYFAHLNYFAKGLKKGTIVKPGEVIGYVGSSGYGPPGTSGKFPPHLHYGLYFYNGYTTYSVDPYPHLKKWEHEKKTESKKQR